MASSLKLFQLIKSLSQSEKRFFRIYSSRHVIGRQNNYLRLFDCIAAQQQYDEAAIKAHFKNEKFIERLPLEKNYLTKMILRALHAYHMQSSAAMRVRNQIQYAEILMNKMLYQHSADMLHSAQKLSDKFHLSTLKLEILRLKKRLWMLSDIKAVQSKKETPKEKLIRIEDLYSEEAQTIQEIQDLNHCWAASQKATAILRKGAKNPDKTDIRAFNYIQKQLKKIKSPTFDTAFFHYDFMAKRSAYQKNTGRHYNWQKKIIKLWHEHSWQMKEQPWLYITSLYNFCISQLNRQAYRGALHSVQMMKQFTEQYPGKCSQELKARVFVHTHTIEQYVCNQKGIYGEVESMIASASKGLREFEHNITPPQRLQLWYGMAYLAFGAGKYKTALKWNNMLLNSGNLFIRDDLHVFSRIMQLIIHYELGNTDILDSLIRSTYRFLKKRERLFGIEKSVIDFIRLKIPKISSAHDLKTAFTDFRDELSKLAMHPHEKQALQYFDLLAWVDSKINRRTFAQSRRYRAGT